MSDLDGVTKGLFRKTDGDSVPDIHERGGRIRYFEDILQMVKDGEMSLENAAQILDSDWAHFKLLINKLIPLLEEKSKASRLDPLTNALNRRAFEEDFDKLIFTQDIGIGLIMIDIDHFKEFNDTYGHSTGDDVLKTVVGSIASCMRPGIDLLARWGGEEFIVVMKDIANKKELKEICERIRIDISETPTIFKTNEKNVVLKINASLGAVLGVDKDLEKLVGIADKMLYKSKEEGRNRSTVFGLDADV